MDDFIQILFKKSRFGRIFAYSAVITILFFTTLNAYMIIVKNNFGLVILSAITFYLIFLVYFIHEIRKSYGKRW